VRGLAFAARPARDDPAPSLGFEFLLRWTPQTAAWRERGATGDRFAVAAAGLDIVPFRVPALPLAPDPSPPGERR
jgi:hypothetical protein